MKFSTAIALLLASLGLNAQASAQQAAGPDTVPTANAPAAASAPSLAREVTALVGTAVNPAGLMTRVEVRWRRPLFRSASPLLSDAHLSFGLSPEVSPSYARANAWVELAPASIVVVRAGVEPAQYFGTFSSLISFRDLQQPFDRDTMRARSGEARPGNALRIYVRPSLRMKVGRLGGQVTGEVERWWSTAEGPYFHEPGRNTLVGVGGGTVRALSAAALYDLSNRVGVGAAYDLTDVPGARGNRRQRIGALATWAAPVSLPFLGRPTVTAMAGTYLRDPSRSGQLFAAPGLEFRLGAVKP